MTKTEAKYIALRFINCEKFVNHCSKLCKTCHYDYEMEQLVEAVKVLVREADKNAKT